MAHDTNKSKIMKQTILLAAGVGLTLITGCVVKSVYPFYTAKDEVSYPALAGAWVEPDANDRDAFWKFDHFGDKAYVLAVVENHQTNHYEAHSFRLKERTFLDLCPTERRENHLPLHYLLQIEPATNSLHFQGLNLEWLSKLLEKNPRALPHILVPGEPGATNNLDLVLTADTPELQQFVLKHLETPDAWTEGIVLKPRESRVNSQPDGGK